MLGTLLPGEAPILNKVLFWFSPFRSLVFEVLVNTAVTHKAVDGCPAIVRAFLAC